jgi:hypothetical protein
MERRAAGGERGPDADDRGRGQDAADHEAMSLLLGKDADEAIFELKKTAQQAQITLAGIYELVRNINEVVLAVKSWIPEKPR